MKIIFRSIDDVKPYERNPRINDAAVEAVAASIREFGFRKPIVVDSDGVIVCGHTCLRAAKSLGLKKVPVHVAADLTEAQVKAFRLADNRTAELAEWDYDLLPLELADLKAMEFDLDSLGWSANDLAELLAPAGTEGLADPDEVPAPPDAPITARGDLWLLGDHRLLCGDSASAADLGRLLDGAAIDLVNTDPPYNVNVEPRSNNAIAAARGSAAGTLKNQHLDVARDHSKTHATGKKLRPKDRPLANDFVTPQAFERLLGAWFANLAAALKPGGAFYIWGGYANVANYPPALKAAGLYFSQAIIWVKEHPVLTRKDFMGNHEWCFYGWREGGGHKFF